MPFSVYDVTPFLQPLVFYINDTKSHTWSDMMVSTALFAHQKNDAGLTQDMFDSFEVVCRRLQGSKEWKGNPIDW
jgi:hypothetical protein